MTGRALIGSLLAGACLTHVAAAQEPPRSQAAPLQAPLRIPVLVQVSDSSGTRISGASIVVLNYARDTLGRGTSGDDGRIIIQVDSGAGDRQVVARKIGFARADMFVHLGKGEAKPVSLVMRTLSVTALPTVTVTEKKKVPYDHITADEIDSMSTIRTIYEARDIVTKLRPAMLDGSHCGGMSSPRRIGVSTSGRTSRLPVYAGLGQGVTIWVNGRRIFSPFIPADSVLQMIRAEHVSEINYENCQSTKIAKNGADNAIFVILKLGIAFDLKSGSFLADEDSVAQAANRKKKKP